MPFAEHVGELVDVEEHDGDIPRRLHCGGEPLAGAGRVVGEGAQVALEVADLAGFALALHEQHTVELQGGRRVEIGRTFVRAERGAVDGAVVVHWSASACNVREWRWSATACSRGAVE